jgi:hypothetical protein
MKYVAMHDRAGNIAALVACPPDSPPVVVTAQPGLFVTEVEAPEGLIGDVAGSEGEKRIAEVLGQFQIKGTSEGKLVKRTSSKERR